MKVILDQIMHYWVLLAFIGGVFSAGFGILGKWLSKRLKSMKAENTAQSEGIQAILRQDIIDSHTKYSTRGCISIHGLEHCESMYKAYKDLGGNSFVSGLMDDIRALPVRQGGTE